MGPALKIRFWHWKLSLWDSNFECSFVLLFYLLLIGKLLALLRVVLSGTSIRIRGFFAKFFFVNFYMSCSCPMCNIRRTLPEKNLWKWVSWKKVAKICQLLTDSDIYYSRVVRQVSFQIRAAKNRRQQQLQDITLDLLSSNRKHTVLFRVFALIMSNSTAFPKKYNFGWTTILPHFGQVSWSYHVAIRDVLALFKLN